jgi:competence protein ComEA
VREPTARSISGLGLVVALLGLGALASIALEEPTIAVEEASSSRPGMLASAPFADVEGTPDAGGASRALVALRSGRPMDVNEAEVADLVLLPRIGPALAERIVTHRRAHGPFSSVEALAEVRGIGPATVEQLRPLVCAGTGCVPSR